jgi:GH24 family phage-related lysozyme (muramidase)
MADLPLNQFRTKAYELTTTEQTLYTTPTGLTTIVLGAQASNIGTLPVSITFTMTKNGVDYVMLNEFVIPPNDSAEVTTGKLVIEEGASVKAVVSANSSCNLIMSILETSNE